MENETNKSGKLSKFGDLLNALEQIAEDQHGMLVGGFAVVAGDQLSEEVVGTNSGCNNCHGGNCAPHCGW